MTVDLIRREKFGDRDTEIHRVDRENSHVTTETDAGVTWLQAKECQVLLGTVGAKIEARKEAFLGPLEEIHPSDTLT